MVTKNDSLKIRGFLTQCAMGLVAGVLNIVFSSTAIKLHVPLLWTRFSP